MGRAPDHERRSQAPDLDCRAGTEGSAVSKPRGIPRGPALLQPAPQLETQAALGHVGVSDAQAVIRPEQALQRQVCEYLDWCLLPPAFYTSIPAGGGGRIRGAILKATGYKAGVPDLMVIYEGRARFLELKSKAGRLSIDQKMTINTIHAAGCETIVCRSLDDVRFSMEYWEIPLRKSR